MADKSALQRARARIKGRLLDLHKKDKDLAEALKVNKASVSAMLNPNPKDPSPERGLLHRLDDIAKFLDVPPSFFFIKREHSVIELHGDEPKLIAHWRRLPKSVQRDVLDMFAFVAGLLPEEREERELWLLVRRLRARKRAEMIQLARDLLRKQQTGEETYTETAAPASSPDTAPSTQTPTLKP